MGCEEWVEDFPQLVIFPWSGVERVLDLSA